MKVGMLGSGAVAKALAAGFMRHGHQVMMGTREPGKLATWAAEHPGARIGTVSEAAAFGEAAVLAVKGSAAEAVLRAAGPALAGKVVMDTTNPIADKPPVNGVLSFFTSLDDSLMERLHRFAPEVRFVKVFSSVGNTRMVNPDFGGVKPSMFICGNDPAARKVVSGVLDQFGWEVEDLGSAEAARAIEPLCMLWCIPGFLRNSWSHAYKVLS